MLSPCAGPWVCTLKSDRECRDIQKGGPTDEEDEKDKDRHDEPAVIREPDEDD